MAIGELVVDTLIAWAAAAVVNGVISLAEYIYNQLIFVFQPKKITQKHTPSYSLHENDKKYIAASQEALYEVLSEKPVEYLLSLDGKDRLSAAEKLVSRLSELYELEDIHVTFGYSEDLTLGGYFQRDEKKIFLNCAHLLTTNMAVTEDFLNTIFHEFRHVVQWKMIESDEYIWYTDEKSVGKIAHNLYPGNYISFDENPRAYLNQYVETDAREIALYILEG